MCDSCGIQNFILYITKLDYFQTLLNFFLLLSSFLPLRSLDDLQIKTFGLCDLNQHTVDLLLLHIQSALTAKAIFSMHGTTMLQALDSGVGFTRAC